MPQAKRDFDAALRRAGQHKTGNDGHRSSELDPSDQMRPNLCRSRPARTPGEEDQSGQIRPNPTVLGALAFLPPSATASSQVTASDTALGGGGIMAVAPNTCGAPLSDSAPMTVSTANAAGQQWRINILDNDPSSAAMAMQLVHSGAGHWQVRLAADSLTRRQLTPGLGRLRDKLRQDSGNRIDDLVFDDGIDPQSGADTPTQS
ncbi:MAG: hypothetical protein FWG56_09440 [Desulfovibrionaceae bacterium]|nr:hypothetical protein [Desulfovibrionaceae bacterium]